MLITAPSWSNSNMLACRLSQPVLPWCWMVSPVTDTHGPVCLSITRGFGRILVAGACDHLPLQTLAQKPANGRG